MAKKAPYNGTLILQQKQVNGGGQTGVCNSIFIHKAKKGSLS